MHYLCYRSVQNQKLHFVVPLPHLHPLIIFDASHHISTNFKPQTLTLCCLLALLHISTMSILASSLLYSLYHFPSPTKLVQSHNTSFDNFSSTSPHLVTWTPFDLNWALERYFRYPHIADVWKTTPGLSNLKNSNFETTPTNLTCKM